MQAGRAGDSGACVTWVLVGKWAEKGEGRVLGGDGKRFEGGTGGVSAEGNRGGGMVVLVREAGSGGMM